jgi:hypothetical protein
MTTYGHGYRYDAAVKKKIKTRSIAKQVRLSHESELIRSRDIEKWESISQELQHIQDKLTRDKEAALLFTQWKFPTLPY